MDIKTNQAQVDVDNLALRLESYYLEVLEKNNFRLFGFKCKNRIVTTFESEEKRKLKDHVIFFKPKSLIRKKKHIVSNHFILKDIMQRFTAEYYDAYFCIDKELYENNKSYLDDIEKQFKDLIELRIIYNEQCKDIVYTDRSKLKDSADYAKK